MMESVEENVDQLHHLTMDMIQTALPLPEPAI